VDKDIDFINMFDKKKLITKCYLSFYLIYQLLIIWKKGWYHGDIKPSNLILNPLQNQIYWIDFEFCNLVNNYNVDKISNFTNFQGTILWVPPNLLKQYNKTIEWTDYDYKHKDCWGILCTIYWIFTGKYLYEFKSSSIKDYIENVINNPTNWNIQTEYKFMNNYFYKWFYLLYNNNDLNIIMSEILYTFKIFIQYIT
jgi:serine/threonine protein kinase